MKVVVKNAFLLSHLNKQLVLTLSFRQTVCEGSCVRNYGPKNRPKRVSAIINTCYE